MTGNDRVLIAREVFPRARSCAMKDGVLEIKLTDRLHARVWPLGGAWEISAATFDVGIILGQGDAPGYRPALDAIRIWLRDNVGVHGAPSEREVLLEGMVQAMSATLRTIREKASKLIEEMSELPAVFTWGNFGPDGELEADEEGG